MTKVANFKKAEHIVCSNMQFIVKIIVKIKKTYISYKTLDIHIVLKFKIARLRTVLLTVTI